MSNDKDKIRIYEAALQDIGQWSQKIQDEAEKQDAGIMMYRGCVAVANLALKEVEGLDDLVYLLSMTFAGSDTEGGCVYVDDDPEVIAPTSKLGNAMAWETEIEAYNYKSDNTLPFQVTPINRKRYFAAKLKNA